QKGGVSILQFITFQPESQPFRHPANGCTDRETLSGSVGVRRPFCESVPAYETDGVSIAVNPFVKGNDGIAEAFVFRFLFLEPGRRGCETRCAHKDHKTQKCDPHYKHSFHSFQLRETSARPHW